jgi:uncharacterized membrane protein YesL
MEKKWKGALIGGIIGFILPWALFLVLYIDCRINQQTDCGFGLGILFGLTLFASLVCLTLGIIVSLLIKFSFKKNKLK